MRARVIMSCFFIHIIDITDEVDIVKTATNLILANSRRLNILDKIQCNNYFLVTNYANFLISFFIVYMQ